MAVRYKFRSAMHYECVDIDGRPSISVRDLKSKVVQSKKLNVHQNFDLVLSDALTGGEYVDENVQISSGSSVIIKRVPAGSVPSNKTYNSSFADFGVKVNNEVKTSCPVDTEINLDDFGVDLCPVPEAILSCSDIDVDKNVNIGNARKNVDATRCSEPPTVGCQKFEANDCSEAIPRGPAHSGNEENNMLETKSKPDVQQCIKTRTAINVNPPDMQNGHFPSELKCPLCNTFFKKAVMIPCCQFSFCEKCIHSLLLEKGRCPKCFSSKCRAEDLLPNVCLRGAIEHFLESQIQFDGPDNALDRYAPDGASGTQAKGTSCAVTVLRKEPELPDSPSAECNSLLRNNASVGGPGSFANPLGRDKSLKSCSLSLKGDRTCYMCGSPDHFIRDCPAAMNSNPMFQTGSAMFPGAMHGKVPPYWNGPPLPHMRPLANIYGNPGMMAAMVPAALHIPTYMPYLPAYSEQFYESYSGDNGYTHRKHDRNSKLDDEKHSVDGKHEKSSRSLIAREWRPYRHSERLSSEVETMPSNSRWHGDDRQKTHNRNSEKRNERMRYHDDFSWNRNLTNKEKDVERKRVKSDVKRHNEKHNSHLEPGLAPSYSGDKKRRQKKTDLSHDSRHSRHKSKLMDDELNHDRWPMVRGSSKAGREDHKRKRVY